MSDIESAPQQARAGFWRRWAAFLIDGVLISVPIQLLVVVLFAMTSGAVQVSTGVVYNNCLRHVAMADLPKDLVPPPPVQANFAVICSTSFFGLETARRLTVSRTTKEGFVTKTVSQAYMLDANDKPKNGTTLDWLVELAILIYLIAMERRLGATVGKRALGVRVIDTLDPRRIGIPLRKAVIRNVMLWSWAFPMLIVLLGYLVLSNGGPEGMMTGSFFTWFAAAGVLGMAWALWMFVDIVRKRDPIYDRLAGTAVLRVPNGVAGTVAT
jgi:uncharacterized RDD family membrane protein YckC